MKSYVRRLSSSSWFLLFLTVAFTAVGTAECHSLRALRRSQEDIAHENNHVGARTEDDYTVVVHENHDDYGDDDGRQQQLHWPTQSQDDATRTRQLNQPDQLNNRRINPTTPEDYTLSTSFKQHRVMCYGDGFTLGIQGQDLARIPYGPILQYYLREELRTSEDHHRTVHVSFVGRDHMPVQDMRTGVTSDIGLLSHIRRIGPQVVVIWAGTVDIVDKNPNKGREKLKTDVLHDIIHLHEKAWLELDVRFTVAIGLPVPPKATAKQAHVIRDVNEALEEWATSRSNRVKFVAFPEMPVEDQWTPNQNHITAMGYQEVAITLTPVVRELLLKQFRVFVYGDSMTYGSVVGSGKVNENGPYPYRHFMEKEIVEQIPNVVTTELGLPGRRAVSSLDMLETPPFGFLSAIRQAGGKAPSVYAADEEESSGGIELVDLVVILLGSSDLTLEKSDYPILTSLIGLHEAATEQANVRHTVNIAIPPSQYQTEHPAKSKVAKKVNDWMSALPSLSVSHLAFPFEYNNKTNNQGFWSEDGFHPSRKGYRVLGQSLAPLAASRLLGYQKRIFCYGDAYTSGTTHADTPHPYPVILHNMWKDVAVGHMGSFHKKKTAIEMADELEELHGLATMLKKTGTTMDVVVITAGTWDVLSNDGTNAEDIFKSIRLLHNTALENGAKHTIIVGLPEAVLKDDKKWMHQRLQAVNQRLRTYANNKGSKVTMIDWPVVDADDVDAESSFWSSNGRHLSREGYEEFAAQIGPTIRSVIS